MLGWAEFSKIETEDLFAHILVENTVKNQRRLLRLVNIRRKGQIVGFVSASMHIPQIPLRLPPPGGLLAGREGNFPGQKRGLLVAIWTPTMGMMKVPFD